MWYTESSVSDMTRLCDKELDKAVEVEMASYQYDNLKLHRRLVGRLKDKSFDRPANW